jgi:hypothetical protein
MSMSSEATGFDRRPRDAGAADDRSYVDWGAIIAGAVVATAISFVLATFGSALGLSFTSAREGEGFGPTALAVAGGIWFIWMSVSGFGAGGYVAGRMRRPHRDAIGDEVEARDGGHGLVVWAVGALLGAMIATSGIGAAGSAVGSAAGTAVEAAGDVGASAAGSAASLLTSESESNLGYLTDRLLRGQGGLPVDEGTRDQVAGLLRRALTEGELPEGDRAYLAQVVSSVTGVDPNAARQQIDAAAQEIAQARETAIQAAETARVAAVISAFLVAATLLVGAVAAYAAAVAGGHHRDRNLQFRPFGGGAEAPARRAV